MISGTFITNPRVNQNDDREVCFLAPPALDSGLRVPPAGRCGLEVILLDGKYGKIQKKTREASAKRQKNVPRTEVKRR